MTVFTKQTDRSIHSEYRSLRIDSSELASGDFIDFVNSLGSAASKIEVVTSDNSDLSIRLNVLNKVYAPRVNDPWGNTLTGQHINVAKPTTFISGTQPTEDLSSTLETSWELKNGPVKNMEVTWTSGTWYLIAKI